MDSTMEERAKKSRKRQMSRAKRVLANRRERERVRKMNDAFEELRSTIPNYEETRVKTKLELLRIATNYIQSLKDSIQNSIPDGYNTPLIYPPAYEMDPNGGLKSGPWISEYPNPTPLPVPPPPTFTELPSFQFPHHHQAVSSGSQFSSPIPNSSETSAQDCYSLWSNGFADSLSGESLLYNVQNAATGLYIEGH